MTTQLAKKMHRGTSNFWASLFLASCVGIIEALLLARLTVQLFAARPDNPSFAWLLALTEPLRAPLAFLDANQPLFGARLEYATLVLVVLVPLLGYLAWIVLHRATVGRSRSS